MYLPAPCCALALPLISCSNCRIGLTDVFTCFLLRPGPAVDLVFKIHYCRIGLTDVFTCSLLRPGPAVDLVFKIHYCRIGLTDVFTCSLLRPGPAVDLGVQNSLL